MPARERTESQPKEWLNGSRLWVKWVQLLQTHDERERAPHDAAKQAATARAVGLSERGQAWLHLRREQEMQDAHMAAEMYSAFLEFLGKPADPEGAEKIEGALKANALTNSTKP